MSRENEEKVQIGENVHVGENLLLQYQENYRDQAISFLKSTIGIVSYQNIPKFNKDLFLHRRPNFSGRYVGFVLEDFVDLNGEVAILEHNDYCISLVIKKGDNLYCYNFEDAEISCCRHGRPLYIGSYSQHFAHYSEIFENEQLHYIFRVLVDFLESNRLREE